jgi:hypothetical protein
MVLVVVSLMFCFCVLPSNASPDHLLSQKRSHVEEMMRPPELEEETNIKVPGQRLGGKRKLMASEKENKGTNKKKTKGETKDVMEAEKETKGATKHKHTGSVAKCRFCESEFDESEVEERSAPVQKPVPEKFRDFDSFFGETMMSMPTQVRQEKSRRPITTIKASILTHNSYLLWM